MLIKMKKTHNSLAILTCTLLIVACVTMVACNKDHNNSSSPIQKEAKGPNVESVSLGYFNPDRNIIELCFDKETFFNLYQAYIDDSIGTNYVIEDISITDEYPYETSNTAVLKLTIFETDSAETISNFLLLAKEPQENGLVVYYTNGNGNERTVVRCRAQRCNDGCDLNPDKTGCTPCKDERGVCKKEVIHHSGGVSLEKWVTLAIEILKLLN